ncbi:LacI family DNA-binding transcriptional regulator [Afifella sp. IM 167]|uniref:LacI family DNA-binding transcriptional regulator n=1 Tax=Afifella sp. IM 167 TaxID=2033586 RepID=UPI001CCCC303|nr:LacI family DNA-binding transcriptional regulator [Afifella sp. IM 167]MBZ8134957.1 LacI family transcriptional regulator [Afifella sp. IM 167]
MTTEPTHPGESPSAPAEGEWRPAGMREVAQLAGVSIATVSRALNEPSRVSAEMRLKVENAVRSLGYIRHGAARALSLRRAHAIGAIIPTVDNARRADKIAALQMRCRERGYSLVLALSQYDLSIELQQCRSLVEVGIDGLMLEGGEHDPAIYELLEKRGIAVVNTSVYDPAAAQPNIGFDNSVAARRLTDHLLDLGHKTVGMIAGPVAGNDRAGGRLAGVRAALAARGLPLPPDLVVERPYRIGEGRLGLRTLLARQPRPTAVICGNDVIAIGALIEAQAQGLDVPRDISIAGFDDLDLAAQMPPGLTTMALPAREIGELAADHLIDSLEGKPVAHATEVEVKLILRGSTGPVPSEASPLGVKNPAETRERDPAG